MSKVVLMVDTNPGTLIKESAVEETVRVLRELGHNVGYTSVMNAWVYDIPVYPIYQKEFEEELMWEKDSIDGYELNMLCAASPSDIYDLQDVRETNNNEEEWDQIDKDFHDHCLCIKAKEIFDDLYDKYGTYDVVGIIDNLAMINDDYKEYCYTLND